MVMGPTGSRARGGDPAARPGLRSALGQPPRPAAARESKFEDRGLGVFLETGLIHPMLNSPGDSPDA